MSKARGCITPGFEMANRHIFKRLLSAYELNQLKSELVFCLIFLYKINIKKAES